LYWAAQIRPHVRDKRFHCHEWFAVLPTSTMVSTWKETGIN
jgi:hypothetical protein